MRNALEIAIYRVILPLPGKKSGIKSHSRSFPAISLASASSTKNLGKTFVKSSVFDEFSNG